MPRFGALAVLVEILFVRFSMKNVKHYFKSIIYAVCDKKFKWIFISDFINDPNKESMPVNLMVFYTMY